MTGVKYALVLPVLLLWASSFCHGAPGLSCGGSYYSTSFSDLVVECGFELTNLMFEDCTFSNVTFSGLINSPFTLSYVIFSNSSGTIEFLSSSSLLMDNYLVTSDSNLNLICISTVKTIESLPVIRMKNSHFESSTIILDFRSTAVATLDRNSETSLSAIELSSSIFRDATASILASQEGYISLNFAVSDNLDVNGILLSSVTFDNVNVKNLSLQFLGDINNFMTSSSYLQYRIFGIHFLNASFSKTTIGSRTALLHSQGLYHLGLQVTSLAKGLSASSTLIGCIYFEQGKWDTVTLKNFLIMGEMTSREYSTQKTIGLAFYDSYKSVTFMNGVIDVDGEVRSSSALGIYFANSTENSFILSTVEIVLSGTWDGSNLLIGVLFELSNADLYMGDVNILLDSFVFLLFICFLFFVFCFLFFVFCL
jgi:hypothetical protein